METVLTSSDLELERMCNSCHGEGTEARPGKSLRDCCICLGTGDVPTAFGQEILDFVNKYAPR